MKLEVLGSDVNVNLFFQEIIKMAKSHNVAIVTAVQGVHVNPYQPEMPCPLISKRYFTDMCIGVTESKDPALKTIKVQKNSIRRSSNG